MSIYAAPGTSFEATVSNATTGLTGTLGVRITDGIGGTTLARQTTGIIETPAASGIYVATLTAPTTAGTYDVTWDTGGSSVVWAVEDLIVTSSALPPSAPSGQDLVTLAQARSFLQKESTETGQDTEISNEITRASFAIQRFCEREFRTATSGSTTRTFECEPGIAGNGLVDLAPFDLRGQPDSVVIDTDQAAPVTLTSVQYRLGPLPAVDGVYNVLRLRPLTRSFGQIMWPQMQVQVTGTWGFADVPQDVQQAALVTVAVWLRRDVQTFSRVLKIDEGQVERPKVLPEQAVGMLASYKRMAVS